MKENLMDNMEKQDLSSPVFRDDIFVIMRDDGKYQYEELKEESVKKHGDQEVVESSGCCDCTPQSRNLILGGLFLVLTTNGMLMLEMSTNKLDITSPNHEFTAYTRVLFVILCMARFAYVANLILLVATVKRNAIYIYPFLVTHHLYMCVLNLILILVEALIMFLTSDYSCREATWLEATISGINLVVCCYCLLVIYHQYNNGWKCGRRVDGEEQKSYKEGSDEPMEISESNRGPIKPYDENEVYDMRIV